MCHYLFDNSEWDRLLLIHGANASPLQTHPLHEDKQMYATLLNATDKVFTAIDFVSINAPKAIAATDDAICTTIDKTYMFCHSVYDFFTTEEMKSWYRLIGSVCALVYAISLYLIATAEKLLADPRTQPPIVGEIVTTIQSAKKARKPRSTTKKVESPTQEEKPVQTVKKARKPRAKKSVVENQAT